MQKKPLFHLSWHHAYYYGKFSEVFKNCGAEIPRWLSHKAEALKNTPEDLQSFISR